MQSFVLVSFVGTLVLPAALFLGRDQRRTVGMKPSPC